MEDTHVYLNKLSEELRLRKHSGQTEKVYTLIIRKFIESGLQPREFLLEYADKSRSSIRSVYFALKFFYENVLRQKFDETIPLAKNKGKLPVVLNKEEISKMFEEAEQLDKEEDEKYGQENRGDELPKELQSKKSREKAIRKAIKKLKKIKEGAEDKIIKEKNREPTESEFKKINKMKINVTDNDAKFMKERNGLIKPNYNAQISVDEKEQFILANDVVDECNDQHQLVPMLNQTKENIGESPKKAKADNGYYPQLEEATNLFPEIDLYVDDKNRRKEDLDLKKIKEEYNEIEYKNLKKLLTKKGNKEYKKRMYTAEPPIGNIKFNLGYRYFLLRGLNKVKGEFNLMCIAHDLKKIVSFISKKKTTLAKALSNIKEDMKEITRIKGSNRLRVVC